MREGLPVSRPAAAHVPRQMPANIGHRRRRISRMPGPSSICQTLVTIEGTTRMAAACEVGMASASRPIEMVGSPKPITPFTKPARRKVATTSDRVRARVWDSMRASRSLSGLVGAPTRGLMIGPRGRAFPCERGHLTGKAEERTWAGSSACPAATLAQTAPRTLRPRRKCPFRPRTGSVAEILPQVRPVLAHSGR